MQMSIINKRNKEIKTLDENCNNSAIYGAMTSRFYMEVNIDNTYNMLMMMMMMIIMMMIMIMMMMIIAVTQSIFKIGPPDVALK